MTNGPATFQRFINCCNFLGCLDDFLTAYLDDLLIYSDNGLDHEIHVKKVLTRLRAAGLQADKKSEFHVRKTKYLGFIVGEDGIEVDPEKVSVLKNWQVPTTVRGIQSFLGLCNFYRLFITNYGRIAKPLAKLTKKNIPFKFDEACERAFRELKTRLLSAPFLFTIARITPRMMVQTRRQWKHWLPLPR